jgi:hypothetical protein
MGIAYFGKGKRSKKKGKKIARGAAIALLPGAKAVFAIKKLRDRKRKRIAAKRKAILVQKKIRSGGIDQVKKLAEIALKKRLQEQAQEQVQAQEQPAQEQPDQEQPDQEQPDQEQPDQEQPDQDQPDQDQPDQKEESEAETVEGWLQ